MSTDSSDEIRLYRIPRCIQAMANVLKKDKFSVHIIHARVAQYLTEYSAGGNDHEREMSRARVRRLLRSVEAVSREETRIRHVQGRKRREEGRGSGEQTEE